MDDMQLRDRIRRRLRQLQIGPVEAATKVGLERSYISDFVREPPKKNSIKREHYVKIAVALDWTVEQLLGERHNALRATQSTEPPSSNVEVPEYDIRAGASYGGGLASEETVDEGGDRTSEVLRASWGIPGPFLRQELGIQPGRVHILPVRGDSMMDALYDGDRAIIDLDDTDFSQGGIFALVDDSGSVIIKQVEPVRGAERRTIRCKSRNTHYETFELHLIEPVRIVGRVACKITRL